MTAPLSFADSAIQVTAVGSDKERMAAFIRFPHELYRHDPAWVAPLDLERKLAFDRQKNPFFAHAQAEFFVAFRGGKAVGRISAQIDQEHLRLHQDAAGFFGNFDCIDDVSVARELFNTAAAWLRERGMKTVRGPYSMNINEEAGLLVDGFQHMPMFIMAHHLPHYRALVEQNGFSKAKELYAWHYDARFEVPPLARRIADRARSHSDITVRTINMAKFDEELRAGLQIFNEAWKDNWGFVPLTEAEMRKAAEDIKLVMDPRIILVAEHKGQAIGMALTIPNINRVLQPLKGKLFPFGWARLLWGTKVKRPKDCRLTLLGVKPEFRGLRTGGLSVLLMVEVYERAKAAGYTSAELSWTLDDNHAINHGIKMMGGQLYKTYYVYERAL